jgi:hypothetical protein
MVLVKKLNEIHKMENLVDYSSYVLASYLITALVLGGLFFITLSKYFNSKSKIKKLLDEK